MGSDLLDDLLARQLTRIRLQLDRLERYVEAERVRNDALFRTAALVGGGMSLLVNLLFWLAQRFLREGGP